MVVITEILNSNLILRDCILFFIKCIVGKGCCFVNLLQQKTSVLMKVLLDWNLNHKENHKTSYIYTTQYTGFEKKHFVILGIPASCRGG